MAFESFTDSVNNDKLDFYDGSLSGKKINKGQESVDKELALAEIVKDSELAQGEVAKNVISNIDAPKLASLIEKTFKGENGWLRYGDMKKNPFYNFYVEATIDHLSDKLLDANGNEVKFMFNSREGTLDEHLKDLNGIDDNYSRNLVILAQKAMGIKESQQDGLAGPQFFAKACAFLDGNGGVVSSDDFIVAGLKKGEYKYGFDTNTVKVNISGTEQNIDCPEGITLASEVGGKRYIMINDNKSIFYIEGGVVKNDIGPSYDKEIYGDIVLEDGKINYKGPDMVSKQINVEQNKLVDELKLTKLTSEINRNYYGLPKDVEIYTRENHKGYYYFEGNSVVYIPDLSNDDGNVYYTKTVYKSGEWINQLVLEPTENVRVYLSNCLSKALADVGLSASEKKISIDGDKFILTSHGYNSGSFGSSILKDGWIFKGDRKNIGNELKMLNLANYLFKLNAEKYKLQGNQFVLHGNKFRYKCGGAEYAVMSDDSFEKYYGSLTDEESTTFCKYVNDNKEKFVA